MSHLSLSPQERPEAYLEKYVPDYQPAGLEAKILELAVPLFCPLPRVATPPPPPKQPDPPKESTRPPPPLKAVPQMRYRSPTPSPQEPLKMGRCTFCDFSGVQDDVIYHLKRSHKAFI